MGGSPEGMGVTAGRIGRRCGGTGGIVHYERLCPDSMGWGGGLRAVFDDHAASAADWRWRAADLELARERRESRGEI